MSINVSDIIIENVSLLVGEKINYIDRAANMFDIGFGDDVEYKNPNKDSTTVVAKFVLHICASWRLISNNKVVLAQKDFYEPKDGISYDKFVKEAFGNSQFDYRAEELNNKLNDVPITVTTITANDLGDLTLHMSNDYRLEIFVDISGKEESWRFFRMDNDSKHFVVFNDAFL